MGGPLWWRSPVSRLRAPVPQLSFSLPTLSLDSGILQ